MRERVAILLDGGFVKKKLQAKLKRFPDPRDVVELCQEIMVKPRLQGLDLFRAYYYDAPPLTGATTNPLNGAKIQFEGTTAALRNQRLLEALELEEDFAVRKGQLIQTGWKLGRQALKGLTRREQRPIRAEDLVPDIAQKGVDIRIGLDIASIALKRVVHILVLVTGDSDFVPPMKFARKEGLRVYLECLGHGVRRELKVHADLVL